MLFNSWVFVLFFFAVYSLYVLFRGHLKLQNLLLLVASYLFYGYWDWRFLGLLVLTSGVDFLLARRIENATDNGAKRKYLLLSVILNLTVLGFFKYFHFFSENTVRLLEVMGLKASPLTLKVVLPVGISFYTFQEMGYVIDVYRGKIRPARNFLDFALFVAFFPQLVAGPIERSKNLLPQIVSPRVMKSEQVHSGIFLILWGYFKKLVIADNLALIANRIFDPALSPVGLDIVVGTLAFGVQIYCDFSGYSDIGRGLAKLMGFELMINFKLPYFAQTPSEFWSRWHISFSTWLRDYLYIPLGGNRKGELKAYRNLLITLLLGGLWHGASWNFVLWGAFHGMLLVTYRFFETSRPTFMATGEESVRPAFAWAKALLMFALTNIGWVIFRSHSLSQAGYLLTHVGPAFSKETLRRGYELAFFCVPLLMVQAVQERTRNLLAPLQWPTWKLAMAYGFCVIWLLTFGVRESMEFIYFQF